MTFSLWLELERTEARVKSNHKFHALLLMLIRQKGCDFKTTNIRFCFNFPILWFPYTLLSLYFDFPTLISLDYDFPIHSWHSYKQKCGRHNLSQSGFFKVLTFFRCYDRDLWELKHDNKFDTDHLFYYILNIQKMCHQNQPSGFFKVWTFFRCFDRDLRELKQNNKLDINQLIYYILNIQKMCHQSQPSGFFKEGRTYSQREPTRLISFDSFDKNWHNLSSSVNLFFVKSKPLTRL